VALSNWDTLALDQDGKPLGGAFASRSEVVVEVYKNWLYVSDKLAWREGEFTCPVVMRIDHGLVRYRDVNILAARGPQEGIYALVWQSRYEENKLVTTGMLGIGVYGYDDQVWIGVQKESLDWFRKEVLEKEEYKYDLPECFSKIDLSSGVRFNQGDMYFAEKTGLPVQATKPGESAPTHMSKILEHMKKGE